MTTGAGSGICDLIMVLNEIYKSRWGKREIGRSAPFPLPLVPLSLIQKSVFDGGDELLGFAAITAEIGFVPAGHRHHRAMMEIVVPQGVKSIAAAFRRLNEFDVLRLVFADDK